MFTRILRIHDDLDKVQALWNETLVSNVISFFLAFLRVGDVLLQADQLITPSFMHSINCS